MADYKLKPGDLVRLSDGREHYAAVKIADKRSFFGICSTDIGIYLGEQRQLRHPYDQEVYTFDLVLLGENKLELEQGILVKAEKK
jgi:hypothetical protein